MMYAVSFSPAIGRAPERSQATKGLVQSGRIASPVRIPRWSVRAPRVATTFALGENVQVCSVEENEL